MRESPLVRERSTVQSRPAAPEKPHKIEAFIICPILPIAWVRLGQKVNTWEEVGKIGGLSFSTRSSSNVPTHTSMSSRRATSLHAPVLATRPHYPPPEHPATAATSQHHAVHFLRTP